MSKNEMVAKIEALNEWEAIIADAQAEAEALRDEIKAEMLDRETEELVAGPTSSAGPLSSPIALTPLPSRRCMATSTKPSPSRSAASASPSAHKKSPLPDNRPKRQARSFHPNPTGEGKTQYSLPSHRNQERSQ